jgi:hypothetical protein
MKQPQYQPMAVWEMALTLFAVNNGFFEGVEMKAMASFERSLRDHIRSKHADLVDRIEKTKDLSKDDESALRSAIEQFKKTGILSLYNAIRSNLENLRKLNGRLKRNSQQDQECAKHTKDHQGNGDGGGI